MDFRSARRVAFCAGATVLALPAVAHATVQIAVPQGCVYASSADITQTIPFNLAGMAAGAHYAVNLNGSQVANGTADATGAASGEFDAPVVTHAEKTATVSVSDGQTTDQKTIQLTDFDAAITPSTGSTRRRVKVSLFGWVGNTVFLHYIPPHSRKPTRTIRVARTTGACGHATTHIRHLFPAGARKGKWRLIFDTRRRYSSKTRLRIEYRTSIR
jgi:hypothetical protein